MAKVELIKDRCIGCGACMTIAPENFTFDDEGRAELININITDEAIEASETCPVSAITIKESCKCSDNCNCDDICNCTAENKCSENCNCDDICNSKPDNKYSENCNSNK